MNIYIKTTLEENIPVLINLVREFAEYENLTDFCEVTEEHIRNAMFGENPVVEGNDFRR